MKGKIIKIISSNYTFLRGNSELRQIWQFLNECFQTEFVDAYCVLSEPRVKLWLIGTHPYWGCLTHALYYCVNETAGKQFPTYRAPLEF